MTDTTTFDPTTELAAMKAVLDALRPLPEGSQTRVLDWAASALGLQIRTGHQSMRVAKHDADIAAGGHVGDGVSINAARTYSAFTDLLGDADPTTDAERALVGGYWHQVILGVEDFASQSVNDDLKDTGNAIGNITRAFDALKNTKPQLVRQLQKTGKAQQARKRLKLTSAGIDRVNRMIAANASGGTP